MPAFARRLHGSSDIFEPSGRRPSASVNFITSHDGFTLRDLVSYEQRHNQSNAEDNNDGHRENLSENFGVEGASDDPVIEAARRRQQRNLLATLLVSQGVPMILAGDELGRSQQGNNNAYCQDNALNWIDWQAADEQASNLTTFVTLLLGLRRDFPVLCHRNYIHLSHKPDSENIQWLNSDGEEMREEQWQEHHSFVLGYLLTGRGNDHTRSSILVIFNNNSQAQQFQLPRYQQVSAQPERCWRWMVDTNCESGVPQRSSVEAGEKLQIENRSVAILCSDNQISSNEESRQ